jgi:hypothetical protein
MIFLKNQTGRSAGKYFCFEYGQDLFGFYFLDIIHGAKHKSQRVKKELFRRPQDLICAMDIEIEVKERYNYLTACIGPGSRAQ